MGDRELSTRDLAKRSDTTAADTPVQTKRQAPQHDAVDQPGGSESSAVETDPADEPIARGRLESDDRPGLSPGDPAAGEREPLLADDESERFTSHWDEIQVSFVDQPRESVAQADALVAELMQSLAAGFSAERERLERQWDSGGDVSTEDLRVALTRYRSFFERLLSA